MLKKETFLMLKEIIIKVLKFLKPSFHRWEYEHDRHFREFKKEHFKVDFFGNVKLIKPIDYSYDPNDFDYDFVVWVTNNG